MRDTIELLESIGRNAMLRRASPEALGQALEAANASAGLRELTAHGDVTTLARELGLKDRSVEQVTQVPAHEGSLLN